VIKKEDPLAQKERKKSSVTATGESSSFVNNVNTIFGNLLLTSIDLSAEGPECSPNTHGVGEKNQLTSQFLIID